jgi:hypothetical protein
MTTDTQQPMFAIAEIVIGPGRFTFVVDSLFWFQGMWSYKCAREGETEAIFTFPEPLLRKVEPSPG